MKKKKNHDDNFLLSSLIFSLQFYISISKCSILYMVYINVGFLEFTNLL